MSRTLVADLDVSGHAPPAERGECDVKIKDVRAPGPFVSPTTPILGAVLASPLALCVAANLTKDDACGRRWLVADEGQICVYESPRLGPGGDGAPRTISGGSSRAGALLLSDPPPPDAAVITVLLGLPLRNEEPTDK